MDTEKTGHCSAFGLMSPFSRSYQLNIELGCNFNNMKSDASFGLQGALNLVHRFGGKEIEK
jgi:hypothetical protein